MKRKFLAADVESVGERQVRVILSTAALDRTGEVVEQAGLQLDNYKANPIWLWQHDPRMPVGNAVEIGLNAKGQLEALVEFAPPGISAKADEICGLVKAGVVRGVSLGFDPIEEEPMDPRKPKGPQHVTRAELLEGSFVSIPANPEAAVTVRALDTTSQERAGMTTETEGADKTKGAATPRAKMIAGTAAPRVKGIYDIGRLIWVMSDLGYAVDCARVEAALEGDGSGVPAMLLDTLQQLGSALIAMTVEEVGEMLAEAAEGIETAGDGDDADAGAAGAMLKDDDVSDLPASDAAAVTASKTPAAAKFRLGYLRAKHQAQRVKEGRKISAATKKALQGIADHHDDAMAMHRKAITSLKHAMAALEDLMVDGDNAATEIQDSDGTDTVGNAGTSEDTSGGKAARLAVMKALDRAV